MGHTLRVGPKMVTSAVPAPSTSFHITFTLSQTDPSHLRARVVARRAAISLKGGSHGLQDRAGSLAASLPRYAMARRVRLSRPAGRGRATLAARGRRGARSTPGPGSGAALTIVVRLLADPDQPGEPG